MEGTILTNGQTEQVSPPNATPASATPTPTSGESEPALNKVVTQLNAKLGSDVTAKHGRDIVHSHQPRASPAVATMPAPPAPPSHLSNLHAQQQAALIALNPHLAQQQQLTHTFAQQQQQHQQLLAAQQGMLGGHPHAAAQQAYIQTPAGLVPIQQPGLMPGQPQPQFIQTPHGLVQIPQHVMLPNGLALARPNLPPQWMQQGAAAPQMQGLLGQQLLRQQMLQAMHARAQTPDPTHVPTAGYVANNVSGYTPSNSMPPTSAQLGQPIPVVANGVVGAQNQAGALHQLQQQQPQQNVMLQMAGLHGGVAGLPGMFAAPGLPGAGAMPGLVSLPSAVPQSMGGLIMTPSPAGLPSLPGQQFLQKMPTLQPGLLPVQNYAVANALKRPLSDSVAVMDKRMRLA